MPEKSTILVVDDSELMLERIKQRLEFDGHRVITTTQVVGAARYLFGTSLAIIDWHMPGIAGGEVLNSFRAACTNSKSSPLFYLYTSDRSITASAVAMGFDGCFINKGDEDSLSHQVNAALRIARLKARR